MVNGGFFLYPLDIGVNINWASSDMKNSVNLSPCGKVKDLIFSKILYFNVT